MHIQRLVLAHFRNHYRCSWEPTPGMNVLLGANAVGKTSLLEAIHVLAYGKSFRCRLSDGLIQRGSDAFDIFIEWSEPLEESGAKQRRAGLHYGRSAWEGKLDGQSVRQLGQLCAALRVITFEPGSHALINGVSQMRRRYLDWGLFHVEPDFWPTWRRYARALKHRNSLLKQKVAIRLLDAWDQELAQAGEALTAMRIRYLTRLHAMLMHVSQVIAPCVELNAITLSPGWRRDNQTLLDALCRARDRDFQLGHTTLGPHRADWYPEFASGVSPQAISRGQAKLMALSCLLAQAHDMAQQFGQWPILLLDDFASELDRAHQSRVLQWLLSVPVQVLVTGADSPSWEETLKNRCAWFHVEHGENVIRAVGSAEQ